MGIVEVFTELTSLVPIIDAGNFFIIIYLLFLTKDLKHKFDVIETHQLDAKDRVAFLDAAVKDLQDFLHEHYNLTKEEALRYLHYHANDGSVATY